MLEMHVCCVYLGLSCPRLVKGKDAILPAPQYEPPNKLLAPPPAIMNSVSGGDNFDAEDCNHVDVQGRIPSRKRDRTVRIDSVQLREGLTRGKLINF